MNNNKVKQEKVNKKKISRRKKNEKKSFHLIYKKEILLGTFDF